MKSLSCLPSTSNNLCYYPNLTATIKTQQYGREQSQVAWTVMGPHVRIPRCTGPKRPSRDWQQPQTVVVQGNFPTETKSKFKGGPESRPFRAIWVQSPPSATALPSP